MKKTMIDFAGSDVPAYILEDAGDFIISIPYINFSLAFEQELNRDDQTETIVAHLFHMMDEDQAEGIAEGITQVTAKQ